MTHRILITTLFDNPARGEAAYYCTKDLSEKTLYCDAALSAEAGCKYLLSANQIDEIIVFGAPSCCASGEGKPASLRSAGQKAISDPKKASAYGILRS